MSITEKISHAAERKAFETVLDSMLKKGQTQDVGGCVAGGRIYCHINAAGDVEPCVFIHYSGANIREKSFLECLQQPLFLEYRKGQPFNGNHLRPCPMLENPYELGRLVAESGAHGTDLVEPETPEDLRRKTVAGAAAWAPVAEKIWNDENDPMYTKRLEGMQQGMAETDLEKFERLGHFGDCQNEK